MYYCPPQYFSQDAESCEGSDDDAYIWSLVEEVKANYNVGDVIIWGHSNGAAMTLTMMCQHSADIFGIIVEAGDASHTIPVDGHPSFSKGCLQEQPVNMLFHHDPNDLVVHYTYGVANMEDAAAANGCYNAHGCPYQVRKLDTLPHLEGVERIGGDIVSFGPRPWNETTHYAYACPPGASTEAFIVQTWGSKTGWFEQGDANPPIGGRLGIGHFDAWGKANDHGEHYALQQRILEWMWQRQHRESCSSLCWSVESGSETVKSVPLPS